MSLKWAYAREKRDVAWRNIRGLRLTATNNSSWWWRFRQSKTFNKLFLFTHSISRHGACRQSPLVSFSAAFFMAPIWLVSVSSAACEELMLLGIGGKRFLLAYMRDGRWKTKIARPDKSEISVITLWAPLTLFFLLWITRYIYFLWYCVCDEMWWWGGGEWIFFSTYLPF